MEDYIDLSSDEKLLNHWEEKCLLRPDQSKTVGVRGNPGVACPKCASRHYSQTFGGPSPDGRPIWISKDLAEQVIQENKKNPHTISDKLADFLIYQNEWEEPHVAHVAAVETPGIIACGALAGKAGKVDLYCYLIDGTHRAVAARRAGRPYKAYVLSFKETFQCVLGPKRVAAANYR